ncbi:interferon-induced GTP-binding protein Mx2 [Pyricularia oryzae]|nr:interferon-induced GTP-binding protein Mx2 [Pyricularia oryzae]
MPQVVEDIRKVLRTTEESLTRLGQAPELFLEQSSRWLPIATAHVENIIAIVTGWLQHATRVVLPEDKLRGDVLAICSQWMEDAGNDALMELDKLKKTSSASRLRTTITTLTTFKSPVMAFCVRPWKVLSKRQQARIIMENSMLATSPWILKSSLRQ